MPVANVLADLKNNRGLVIMHNWGLACCVVASLLSTTLSLAFAEADMGAVLCVGIALISGSLLLLRAVVSKGGQRVSTFLY